MHKRLLRTDHSPNSSGTFCIFKEAQRIFWLAQLNPQTDMHKEHTQLYTERTSNLMSSQVCCHILRISTNALCIKHMSPLSYVTVIPTRPQYKVYFTITRREHIQKLREKIRLAQTVGLTSLNYISRAGPYAVCTKLGTFTDKICGQSEGESKHAFRLHSIT